MPESYFSRINLCKIMKLCNFQAPSSNFLELLVKLVKFLANYFSGNSGSPNLVLQSSTDQESQGTTGKNTKLTSECLAPKPGPLMPKQAKAYNGLNGSGEELNGSSSNYSSRKEPQVVETVHTKSKQKHDSRPSAEELEIKMRNFCASSERWLGCANGYRKIRQSGIQISFSTYLRGILGPSDFRELTECCLQPKQAPASGTKE